MRRIASQVLACTVVALGLPADARAQLHARNLLDNVYWDATGNMENHQWGFVGLDTLGRVTDAIPHAFAVGENAGPTRGFIGSMVYNRFKLDTARQFEFPGQAVFKARMNHDTFPDYVCWNKDLRRITVLFGTARVDSFRTALVLQGTGDLLANLDQGIVVTDCDGDSLDDLVISDAVYTGGAKPGHYIGHLEFFPGGDTMYDTPIDSLIGDSVTRNIGGPICKVRLGLSHEPCIIEARESNRQDNDTFPLVVYPLGAGFHLRPLDTLQFVNVGNGSTTGGMFIADVDRDGTDEILYGTTTSVLVYKVTTDSFIQPWFRFHKPVSTGSATFGLKVVDVGDVTGKGYPSLLVTDPDGDLAGGYFGGTIFLFNMGRALKDSAVAFASLQDDETYFGMQAIAEEDINYDGLGDFIVGYDKSILGKDHLGALTQFLGNPDYGPLVRVQDKWSTPTVFRLDQNYPNPCTSSTDITFAVLSRRMYGAEVTIKLFDILGNERATLYRGVADGFGYTIRLDATRLPAGTYLYRLMCGGYQETRVMNVVR